MGALELIAYIFYNALYFAAPLIFTGLGTTFSERSGVTNMGVEGGMQVGAFTAIVTNLYLAEPFGNLTPWV